MKTKPRSLTARLFGRNPGPEARNPDRRERFEFKKFLGHYRNAIIPIMVLVGVGFLMHRAGLLIGFENAGLDTLLRLRGRQMSQRVVIIEITDEDFENPELFGGTSPLKKKPLLDLLSAVQDYHPAAVGMDFNTVSQEWCRFDALQLARALPGGLDPDKKPATPVVWAQVPGGPDEPVTLTRVLGGRLQDKEYTGLPKFPMDSDGMLRRYEQNFTVRGELPGCGADSGKTAVDRSRQNDESASADKLATMHSFAGAVIARACPLLKEKCPAESEKHEEPVIFNFYGDRYRFPIIQAHEFIGQVAQEHANDEHLIKTRQCLLANKIVLIGGNFSAARDVYPTPLGRMAGVELIALAIESEFSGGIRETQEVLELLADFLVGSLIVLIYFYYERRPRFALLCSLLGVPIVSIIFSWAIFSTTAYWFNFIPIIIGMVMHQMLELSESTAKLQEALLHVERRNPSGRHEAASGELIATGEHDLGDQSGVPAPGVKQTDLQEIHDRTPRVQQPRGDAT